MGPFKSRGVSDETQDVSSASASSLIAESCFEEAESEIEVVSPGPNFSDGSTRLRFFFLGSPLNVRALTILPRWSMRFFRYCSWW